MQLSWCAYCGSRARHYCPVCESPNVVSVAYGYPSDEMINRAERGEILLGGCVVAQGAPASGCGDCGTRWKVEEDTEGPPLSTAGYAWIASESLAGIPSEFEVLVDEFNNLASRPIPPLLADHQTLESMLPGPLQDPGAGEHWYKEVDIEVACSGTCRDLLLAEDDWTPVSVWSMGEGRAWRLAGRGPYLSGHSVVVVVSSDGPLVGFLKDGKLVDAGLENPRLTAFAGNAAALLAGWYVALEETIAEAPERGYQRSLVPVDIVRGQRWGALMVPVHSEDRTEETEPLVVAVPSFDATPFVADQIRENLRVRGVVPPSQNRMIHLLSEVFERLTRSEEWRDQRDLPAREPKGFTCLHPSTAGEVCLRCGTPYRPSLGGPVEEKLATIRRYGAHKLFQGRIHIEGTPPLKGFEQLPGERIEPSKVQWRESKTGRSG